MDGVLANFKDPYLKALLDNPMQPFPQSRWGFFLVLPEITDAISSFHMLSKKYDMWILTRPSIRNVNCYTEKAQWLIDHIGGDILNRTIMSCDKSLVKGDYLIDDQLEYGQTEFEGELLHFGSEKFPNWKTVVEYLN
jgi:5'(3')-deoxyribonucleotidase